MKFSTGLVTTSLIGLNITGYGEETKHLLGAFWRGARCGFTGAIVAKKYLKVKNNKKNK